MGVNINPFIADAQRIQNETGIPASIILGQIILESGGQYAGGLSGLAYQGKNLFGIKGSGTAGSINMPTTEYKNGVAYKVNADFAKYNSYYDSIQAHAKLLSKDHYAQYFKDAKSINDFANGLQKAGYATSPVYAQKLLNTIQDNQLTKFDTGNYTFTPLTGDTPTTGGGASGSDNASGMLFQIVRIGLVGLFFLVAVILFIKMMPVDTSAITSAIPATKMVL